MNTNPLVSVVIPCYNHEVYVEDCIKSVIDQTYENIELIIIDDGSKDNSVEVIKRYIPVCENRFVRFMFTSRNNKGISTTLNEALDWCKGEYLSVIASDDMMLERKIEIQIAEFKKLSNDKIIGIYGGINQIDENGNQIRTITGKRKLYTFKDIARFDFFLQAPTQIFITEEVRKVGGFDETLKIEDWYIQLRMTQNGAKILVVSEVLANYRRHENNTSKNISIMNEKLKILSLVIKDEKKIVEYKPYIILSIINDNAINSKLKSLFDLISLVLSKPSFLYKKKLMKVFLKIMIPRVFLKDYL